MHNIELLLNTAAFKKKVEYTKVNLCVSMQHLPEGVGEVRAASRGCGPLFCHLGKTLTLIVHIFISFNESITCISITVQLHK